MSDTKKIEVMENIHSENDRIAEEVKQKMTEKGIFVANVMGAPGAGKTSSLKQIIKRLHDMKPYVIEGDIESDLDTVTLRNLGVETIQINTGGACHLDSPLIRKATEDMSIHDKGILFIENIGNLVCPAEFVIGEHVKLLIVTVADGSDKPYKYPLAFEKADAILLNKVDLMPYVDFDETFFMNGVRALNKEAPVFKVSGKTGDGYDEVVLWLEKKSAEQ
jgi:hydrogenase nickel incorporation protein HypB